MIGGVGPGFLLQPEVYGSIDGIHDLGTVLERLWSNLPSDSTIYIASAFANQSGVLTIAKKIDRHTDAGGEVHCFLAGSPHQALASKQAVKELLRSGAHVYLLNRKRILHSKMYGVLDGASETLVVSSGNLTGPGLSLNVESTLVLDPELVETIGFSWTDWEASLLDAFDWHRPDLANIDDPADPAWKLTFDETGGRPVHVPGEEDEEGRRDEILAFSLVHNDVSRIQDGDNVGTQYFFLSRYHSHYFPPLQDRTRDDAKTTFSTEVSVEFLDIGETKDDVSVTFEAYNNLDFRLLTTPLKGTGVAGEGDIAVLAREDDASYKLRTLRQGTQEYNRVLPYLINEIGNRGKRFGWVPRSEVAGVL